LTVQLRNTPTLTLPRQRGREYYLPTQFEKEPVFPSPSPRIKYGAGSNPSSPRHRL
jgi:hypothetical protein